MTSKSIIPSGYVLAKDTDFKWEKYYPWYGAWHYIGSDDKVVIPHTIQGKDATSYGYMFYNTSVSGVYSDNLNVTDMSGMFCCSKATSLDLTYLDTSKVTNMENMFANSEATSLDLSSFDTSKVINMGNMFCDLRAKTLDLSSFDTSKVTNMSYMFAGSQTTILGLSTFDTSKVTDIYDMFADVKATICYVRTQEELDEFSSLSGNPATLLFKVKS